MYLKCMQNLSLNESMVCKKSLSEYFVKLVNKLYFELMMIYYINGLYNTYIYIVLK